MKKPGKPKPKPKRRAQQLPATRAAERRSTSARSGSAGGVAKPRANAIALSPSLGQQHEERTRLALLLLPFLIVAVSLGMAQTRRNVLPSLPDIAVRPPVEKIAIAPPPAHVPAVPKVAPATPPPVPAISEPVRLPAPPAQAVPEPVAPPVLFPPPVPVIESKLAAALPMPPEPIAVPLPSFAQFPPPPPARIDPPAPAPQLTPPTAPSSPAPAQQIAALDARPPAPPIAPAIAVPPANPAVSAPPSSPEAGFCAPSPSLLASFSTAGRLARHQRIPRLTGIDSETFGQRLAAAAVAQTKDLVIYTARYQAMAYPMGDVLALHGACIDVVIRAYRTLGIDLQEDVQRGRPSRGDTNIDHRRTENMRRFLEKNGASLPVTAFPEDYKPGDIVTYHRPFSRVSTSHIAIVSDVLAPTGRPMIVHNRGYGPQLEDALFVDRITGHYRYTGSTVPPTSEARASPRPG